MPEQREGLERDVRSLVREVVAGLLDGGDEAPPSAQPEIETAEAPVDQSSIAIGCDHGGLPLKEKIAFELRQAGYKVHDCGTDSTDAVDYPDFAHEVARLVADGICSSGIVVDGAGIGSAMVANKVPGIRASLCYDLSSARNAREHNHANVLTLGAGLIGPALAWQIVQEWLATPWAGGRHERRVAKIDDIDRRYRSGA
jgi:RpiB/LacA/LacB family sugar-phosphate isomerase